MKNLATFLLGSLGFGTAVLSAADWPQWRGPNFDGSSPETGLPEKVSLTGGLSWQADLPGPSGATPVTGGGAVFLTAAVESEKKLYAICIDAGTGKERWRQAVAEGFRTDERSNLASPSPVVGDGRVTFYFGTGDLITYDFSGREIWKRNLMKDYGRFATQWTYSTSPLLYDGRLYIQVLQRNKAFPFGGIQKGEPDGKNESYLLALEPATGRELWRHVRPSDAVEESLEAFTTPQPAVLGGRKEILVAGGDHISGHDPATGAEYWRWGSWNPGKIGHWRLVTSPVAGGNVALACAPKQEPVYAVKAGLSGAHSGEGSLAWRSLRKDEEGPKEAKNVSSDVATPLFYQGHFYIMNGDGRKNLSCVEPATGKVLWNEEIGTKAKVEASPTGADGKIYILDHKGELFVVKADPAKFTLLHRAELATGAQDTRSGVAVANGRLFVRLNDRLLCFRK